MLSLVLSQGERLETGLVNHPFRDHEPGISQSDPSSRQSLGGIWADCAHLVCEGWVGEWIAGDGLRTDAGGRVPQGRRSRGLEVGEEEDEGRCGGSGSGSGCGRAELPSQHMQTELGPMQDCKICLVFCGFPK